MKLFRKRIKGNNKGLSLVELVCAVAIFGVAATAIGSAMVVSAQSYSRGTYELDVQEEAQTATNIVGNLIFDAVSAKQDGNVVTINGEGKTYTITYDEDAQTLNYEEDPGDHTGVLAENVTSFDTSLTPNANDFKADRNVKVEIAIEKNGRTYEATYNTTGRNGSSNAEGVEESATIIVDSTVVVEPGQKTVGVELPVMVAGSAVNKDFDVIESESDIEVVKGTNKVTIKAEPSAMGSYTFIIQTVASDASGPLDEKLVTVLIRRMTSVNGVDKAVTGDEGSNGSSYKMTFEGVGTNLNKVYGRDYDTNYVDPRQYSFEYSMTGAEAGKTYSDYIDMSSIVAQTTGVTPSVSFKLKSDMPMGSKITVTCVSLHSTGTNKSGTNYGKVSGDLEIYKSPFLSNGKIGRGNDGNIKISVDSSFNQKLLNENSGCTINKIMEFYEANMDATGKFTKKSTTPVFTYLCTDQGLETYIRNVDSTRMIPNQAYIMVIRLEVVDGSGNVKWPDDSVDSALYQHEYPISPISITYKNFNGHAGTSSDPYKITKGTPYNQESMCPGFQTSGLDMSKSWRDDLRWKVEKKVGNDWIPDDSIKDLNYMSGYVDGSGTLQLKGTETGHYRLLTWMDATYRNYADTENVDGVFNFYDTTTGAGIVYIDVE